MMKNLLYIFSVLLLCCAGCKKDKTDFSYHGEPTQEAINYSPVRIVNLMGGLWVELKANGVPLTSFHPFNPRDAFDIVGTKYFPETGRMGATYNIPQEFIRADGKAAMAICTAGLDSLPFEVDEHAFAFPDYYTAGVYSGLITVVPRSVAPPANPQYCKVRLLNLGYSGDPAGLTGPMSLVWADGTELGTATNDVAPGQYSDYVEVPYGTYQFKVVTQDDRPLPASGGSAEFLNTVNGSTGTVTNQKADTWLTYAPFRSYQPGGVYTIVVSPGEFLYFPPGEQFEFPILLNSFRIISDISDPVNTTYGRIQAVNALPGKEITVSVDDQPLQQIPVAYTGSTDYGRFVVGTHTVRARDKDGTLLKEETINLSGSDNLTAWFFPKADGQVAVSMVANNLSSYFYHEGDTVNAEDGSYSQQRMLFPLWMRFLNLCPDFPEVSFTDNNGIKFAPKSEYGYTTAASQHLLFGQPKTEQPYVQFTGILPPRLVYAYVSAPNIFPGNLLRQVPPLQSSAFIARPEWYPVIQRPAAESGIYTIALVGSDDPAAPAAHRPKMIIVKHNK